MNTKKQEVIKKGLDAAETNKAKNSNKKSKKKISKQAKPKEVFESKKPTIEIREIKLDQLKTLEYDQEQCHQQDEQKMHVEKEDSKNETKQTRHLLMLRAKELGIKNFRILNKAELTQVLSETATQDAINSIVAKAVARWKSCEWFKKDKVEAASSAVWKAKK